jgi:hypothetical protein
MSKAHFYSQVIEIESLIVELDKMDLSEDERSHLASLIDSSLHHTVLDAVLSELPEQDKKVFLKHLEKNDHPKIWTHLNKKVDNIEEKIKKAAEELKTELHKDLKEAKQVK